MIEAYGFEIFRPVASRVRAWAHELRGEYPEALTDLEQAMELEPASTTLRTQAARILRTMGELDRASTELEGVLKVSPYNPQANLELGLVYVAQDQREAARELLGRARMGWADADLGHRWASVLAEALAELDGSS